MLRNVLFLNEEVRKLELTFDEGPIWRVIRGKGIPFVVLCGFASGPLNWEDFVRDLHNETGQPVICLWAPRDSVSLWRCPISQTAARIREALDSLDIDTSQFILVSHSMGCTTGTILACELGAERIIKLFLVCPAGQQHNNPFKLLRRWVSYVVNDARSSKTSSVNSVAQKLRDQESKRYILANKLLALREWWAIGKFRGFQRIIEQLTVGSKLDVMYLLGEYDSLFPPQETLSALVELRQSRFAIMPWGHNPHAEESTRKLLISCLTRFLLT